MTLFFTFYFFLLGTVLGSFYNVVGLRLPAGESFVNSRSVCPRCQRQLTWRELVPVFSYLMQKGKCRGCRLPISPIYPFTELASGLLFAYSYYEFGWSLELIIALFLISMLAILWVSDLTYMIIPNKILLFFLPFFIFLRILLPLDPWWSPWVGGLGGYVLIMLIILISKGGMGGGDMKLFGVLGIVLGIQGVFVAFFFSTIYGTLGSLILLVIGKVKKKDAIPFGPYIVMGALTSYFFAEELLQWYLSFYIR